MSTEVDQEESNSGDEWLNDMSVKEPDASMSTTDTNYCRNHIGGVRTVLPNTRAFLSLILYPLLKDPFFIETLFV